MSAQNTHCNFSKILKLKIESVCSFVHNFFESLKSWKFKSLAGSTVVKNLPASAGDTDSIPGSGRWPGGGHGNWLQCCCLENPMDRGAWWTAVHRVTKSRTWLSANTHTHPWRIPWTEEPGGLQSIGSQRAGHDWAQTHTHTHTHIHTGQWGRSVKYGGVQDLQTWGPKF